MEDVKKSSDIKTIETNISSDFSGSAPILSEESPEAENQSDSKQSEEESKVGKTE
jgi:hypothetical protein